MRKWKWEEVDEDEDMVQGTEEEDVQCRANTELILNLY